MYTAKLVIKNKIIMFKNKKIWKQKFALKKGGAPRLELYSEEGEGKWKNVSVRIDGKEIGRIENRKQLSRGVDFNLEDGSILSFKTQRNFKLNISGQPYILINRKPVPGSDARGKFILAYSIIFLIAIQTFWGNVLLDILRIVSPTKESGITPLDSSDPAHILAYSIVMVAFYGVISIVFAVLGFLVRSKSKIALWLAIILYGIDTIIATVEFVSKINSLSTAAVSSSPDSPGSTLVRMVFHVFLLIWMWQGLKAIDEIKKIEF
jgi:hypothetical protein